MIKTNFTIEGIPAVLWGTPGDRLIVAVHGMLGSKDDFELLATEAAAKGCRVLSFDLPEHGERKADRYACNPPNAVKDLTSIIQYAQTLSSRISLYANGVLLAEFTDATWTAGYLGVYIGAVDTKNYTIRIDEMAYWENP